MLQAQSDHIGFAASLRFRVLLHQVFSGRLKYSPPSAVDRKFQHTTHLGQNASFEGIVRYGTFGINAGLSLLFELSDNPVTIQWIGQRIE